MQRRHERLLACAVLAWLVSAIVNLLTGPSLGHDEAMFALIARGEVPPWIYRSRGVVALGEIGVALGGADWQLRIANTLVGVALPLAVFAAGRAAFDSTTGAWAAAAIAGAHPMVMQNARLLGDLPAAAGVVAGIAVLAHELSRDDGPRWRIVLAAPAFAAAFYMRYASAPVIALAGVAALVLWLRVIIARPLPVLAAAATFVMLLVPHALHAVRETGSVLGVLEFAATVPRRAYVGEGLVTYVTSNPFVFYGALVAPLMLAAFVTLARVRRRAPWLLGIVAIGQLVAIGLQSHATPRYVFIAVALLVVLGVATVRAYVPVRIAIALVIAAWLGATIVTVVSNVRVTASRAPTVAAADVVRADRKTPCVILAPFVIQTLEWYTGCEGVDTASFDRNALFPDRDRYLITVPYRELDVAAFAATHGIVLDELPTRDPRARVFRLRR